MKLCDIPNGIVFGITETHNNRYVRLNGNYEIKEVYGKWGAYVRYQNVIDLNTGKLDTIDEQATVYPFLHTTKKYSKTIYYKVSKTLGKVEQIISINRDRSGHWSTHNSRIKKWISSPKKYLITPGDPGLDHVAIEITKEQADSIIAGWKKNGF